jgi:hypothetical protein
VDFHLIMLPSSLGCEGYRECIPASKAEAWRTADKNERIGWKKMRKEGRRLIQSLPHFPCTKFHPRLWCLHVLVVHRQGNIGHFTPPSASRIDRDGQHLLRAHFVSRTHRCVNNNLKLVRQDENVFISHSRYLEVRLVWHSMVRW